jgi:amidohydrolase
MNQVDQEIAAIKNELVEIRKCLHRFPELGFKEYRTAEKVVGYLRDLGFEIQSEIGGTGVIGLLRGKSEGPTIALRACLDALAIPEKSGVDYASQIEGCMHACGHDGNMAITIGAAKVLSRHKNELKGNIKFIFQASEENTGGAAEIIKAGGLNNPDVQAIITPHVFHGIPKGVIVLKAGPVMASSDLFKLEIIGIPGHGAWPHLAVDPIPVAAEVITALQKIVSREVNPFCAAAISIGKIEGGCAENIISESVTMYGTVRSLDENARSFIQKRIEEVAKGVTQSARATYQLTYNCIMPPLNNDAGFIEMATETLKKVFPAEIITAEMEPHMGCEEFSLYAEKIPGIFMFIGNDVKGGATIPIHDPKFIFQDDILEVGVKALCVIALEYTGAPSK